MKKFCIILAFAFAMMPLAASGQTEIRHQGDTLGVSNSGRELITITRAEGSQLSLSIGGFTIDLDGSGKPNRHPRHAQPQTSGRRRRSRNFTVDGFQFGFTALTKPDYSMYDGDMWKFMDLNNGKSISFAFEGKFNFALSYTDRTWISFGVRPRWNNYVFSEHITIVKHEGMIHPVRLDDMKRFKKSKLATFALDIPVMFEFSPVKHLSLKGGVYGGFTLGDHTKVKFKKDKDKGDFGVNFLNAGLLMRVQYRNIGIFADYSFTPLFKDGVGPKTHPFTIGIVLW